VPAERDHLRELLGLPDDGLGALGLAADRRLDPAGVDGVDTDAY
jgi:hypothetical protein